MTRSTTEGPLVAPAPGGDAAPPDRRPFSSLLLATALLKPGRGWWARLVLSVGRIYPSLTLDRLYMIHIAEWSTTRVRRRAGGIKRPLLVFVANHNAGADDYIASFALFVRDRINHAFGTNVDWEDVMTTRLLTDYVVAHEQTVSCSYWAYPNSTVTDIVGALDARDTWDHLVRRSRAPAANLREEFLGSLRELMKPPERRIGGLLRARYVARSLLQLPKWRSSTFCISIPPGRVDQVRNAIAALKEMEHAVFDQIGGVHFATVSIVTTVIDGYPTLLASRPVDLQTPMLVLSIQHDGGRNQLLQRMSELHPRLCAVLEGCTPGGAKPRKGWPPFLRAHRTLRGLTVNAYPAATLGQVQAALPIRSKLLDLALHVKDDDFESRLRQALQSDVERRRIPRGETVIPDPGTAPSVAVATHEESPNDPSADLQGNLLKGYSPTRLLAGRHLFLTIIDQGRAQAWLRRRLDARMITTASNQDGQQAINVAFTFKGLETWGVAQDELAGLPQEFREGMAARAARELGDTGESNPSNWETRDELHLVVMIRASDQSAIDKIVADPDFSPRDHGFALVREQPIYIRVEGDRAREPFGFVDGISQPYLKIANQPKYRCGQLPSALGEFVLGHPDEDGAPEEWTQTTLTQNGTFLVYRKLQQDVEEFKKYVKDDELLAAEMIGRWKDGSPLVCGRTRPMVGTPPPNFSYANDADGHLCPIGAHIRRANPRDSLDPDGKRAQRHRLIRRGVPYKDPSGEVGIIFLAYCAHIGRQFEFVQGQWLQAGHVFGLGTEQDPLTGSGRFQVQDKKDPAVLCLPSFVTTRWGEYFLQPSMSALANLSGPVPISPPS